MAISEKPWSGSSANYKDAASYCAACLIDINTGKDKIAGNCKLPVFEPDGALNRAAAHNAASRIDQVSGVSSSVKEAAARKLVSLYRQLKESPPSSLLRLAHESINNSIRNAASKGLKG